MTTSPSSAQPPSPFSPGSDAGAPGGRAGLAGERGGGTVIKPALSPAASPVIDAAMVRALELARAAGAAGEVPVGAVVLSPEGAVLAEAGLPAFRADQISRHYFTRFTRDAADMTDLPAGGRDRLVAELLPERAPERPRI